MMRALVFVVLLAAVPATVNAQAADSDAILLQCRDISKKSQRLECFDRAMDTIYGVDEVAEAEREELKRDNFGDLAAAEEDTADEIRATITHVESDQRYGILRFQLDNGSVWQATTQGNLRNGFEPGNEVVIEKGMLGGFRLRIPGYKSWRGVKRID